MTFLLSLFALLWLWIGFVSSIDAYFTVKYAESLQAMELNPMAGWIMSQDNWDVSRFIAIKKFCTILVLGVLSSILAIRPFHALIVAINLAILQTLLLLFLLFA